MSKQTEFLEQLFREHRSLKKRLKLSANGCLEYRGPLRGSLKGNPLIGLSSGKTTVHLRRLIWEQYYGPLPKGKYVHMSCNNNICSQPLHMMILPTHHQYSPSSRQYIIRFSPNKIRTILWYRNKVSASLLSKVFHLKEPLIRSIWVNSYCQKIPFPSG